MKSKRLLANAPAQETKTIDMPWARLQTMEGPVPPPLPHGLAWQRCHREHQTNGWRDRKGKKGQGGGGGEQTIVLGVEKEVL